MNFTLKNQALILALLSAFSSEYIFAENTQNNQENQDNQNNNSNIVSQDLNTIVVKGQPFAQKMGTQRITNKQILTRPKNNGVITDLLHDNPNIQFSNISGSSESAGEINPENVSFHGEKFYNNNWQIDGMSNNDNTNPGAGAGYSNNSDAGAYDLPNGGSQSFYVNADILQRVDVYDSNISAKYGQFTGGVVDAKLKDPDEKKASGSFSFRTGRDSWTRYHVEDPSFYLAEQNYQQPKFTKYSYSLNLNQPINSQSALLFSYNRLQSTIPTHHHDMNKWENQTRLNETYVLKGSHKLDNGDTLKATAFYAPHSSKQLRNDVQNGSYTNHGGGLRFNLEWKHLFDLFGHSGTVESYLGYQSTRNLVKNESSFYTTYNLNNQIATSLVPAQYSCRNSASKCIPYSVPNDLNWVSVYNATTGLPSLAHYGGYGRFETTKKTITAKQDYELLDLPLPSFLHSKKSNSLDKSDKYKHDLSFGWSADFAQAGYERHQDIYNYGDGLTNIRAVNNRECLKDSESSDCNYGQYHQSRDFYPARNVKVGNNHYAAYLEDKIKLNKWEITAGLRLDYDRFLKNINIAPRLTASYDILGNEKTVLFGGINRYYANSVLAYKLKKSIGTGYRQTRSLPSDDWTTATRPYAEYIQKNKLRTPSSDELNLGLRQRWGQSEWTFKWVYRKGKNGLGWEHQQSPDKKTITTVRVLNNKSHSSGNTFTLGWNWLTPIKMKYATIHISGGANYSKNKTNSATYDGTSTSSIDTGRLSEEDNDNKVIFNNQLINKNDLPALDFNTPWTVFSNISVDIPKINLNWSTRLNYQAGYKNYSTSLERCPSYDAQICGDYTGSVGVYNREKFKNVFTVDFGLTYGINTFKKQKLELTADILNVFDRTARKRTSRANVSGNQPTYALGRQFWLGARYTW